jgi:phosphatidylserine synthase
MHELDAGGRRPIRRLAAGLCVAVSGMYLLIGTQVVTVIDEPGDQPGFAIPAAIVFAIGAVLLITLDRLAVWAVGAALQVPFIAMYLAVAAERTPTFEAWGISIRVLQVAILAALLRLVASGVTKHRALHHRLPAPPARGATA